MSTIIITPVHLCTDLDLLHRVDAAMFELSPNFIGRIRAVSRVTRDHGLFQAVMHSGVATYLNLESLADREGTEAVTLSDLSALDVPTDLNYLSVERDSFTHTATERHAEIDPMFKTEDVDIALLDSTADIIVLEQGQDGPKPIHLAANQLTVSHLWAVAGL